MRDGKKLLSYDVVFFFNEVPSQKNEIRSLFH